MYILYIYIKILYIMYIHQNPIVSVKFMLYIHICVLDYLVYTHLYIYTHISIYTLLITETPLPSELVSIRPQGISGT